MVDSTQPLNVDINAIVTDLNNKADRDFANTNLSTFLNNKTDKDLGNSTRPYVVSRTTSGGSTVELWSDGYCHQWGTITMPKMNANTPTTYVVTLPQKMKDANYYVAPLTFITDGGNTQYTRNFHNDRTTTTLTIGVYSQSNNVTNSYTAQWRIEGWYK